MGMETRTVLWLVPAGGLESIQRSSARSWCHMGMLHLFTQTAYAIMCLQRNARQVLHFGTACINSSKIVAKFSPLGCHGGLWSSVAFLTSFQLSGCAWLTFGLHHVLAIPALSVSPSTTPKGERNIARAVYACTCRCNWLFVTRQH
jgi:hypothetical protein